MKENMGGEELGKAKSHSWVAQQFCSFCINIEDLDKGGTFYQLDWRLVKTYCKKNYFLLK